MSRCPGRGLGRDGYDGHLTVVCPYLSANQSLGAYREKYTAPRRPVGGTAEAYNADGVRNDLPGDLVADLATGTIALGLAGPCWGHADDPLGPYRRRPFEVPTSAWYGRNGAPAALKAATLLAGICVLIGEAVTDVTYGLAGQPAITGQPGALWLWEAYVTGDYRTSTALLPPPAAETWHRHRAYPPIVPLDANSLNQGIVDVFSAVRHGFANAPTPQNTQRTGPDHGYVELRRQVVPIIGPALASTSLVPSGPGWWDDPCMVIAPTAGSGHLMWP